MEGEGRGGRRKERKRKGTEGGREEGSKDGRVAKKIVDVVSFRDCNGSTARYRGEDNAAQRQRRNQKQSRRACFCYSRFEYREQALLVRRCRWSGWLAG